MGLSRGGSRDGCTGPRRRAIISPWRSESLLLTGNEANCVRYQSRCSEGALLLNVALWHELHETERSDMGTPCGAMQERNSLPVAEASRRGANNAWNHGWVEPVAIECG